MQVTIAEWTRRRPFRASARNGHRRVPSAGGHYVRHLGLTNHARDVVLINQWKRKLNDNLETGPYGVKKGVISAAKWTFSNISKYLGYMILSDFSYVQYACGCIYELHFGENCMAKNGWFGIYRSETAKMAKIETFPDISQNEEIRSSWFSELGTQMVPCWLCCCSLLLLHSLSAMMYI